ncbi:MAG: hypothetical protein AAGC63_00935 [Propionicimonas sp.]|nr:hypothetical protein [Propionicimonas sp.]
MTHATTPDETAELLADNGFAFTDQPDATEDGGSGGDDDLDPEFQPRLHTRTPWLTRVLVWLVVFLAGFVVGVLADRAFVG